METWVLRCKLYPEQRRGEAYRLTRPLRGGGLILRVIAGLDRWLSRQNPAYRPASQQKSTARKSGAFLLCQRTSNYSLLHSPVGCGLLDAPPKIGTIFGCFAIFGGVILFQNHRRVKDAAPYESVYYRNNKLPFYIFAYQSNIDKKIPQSEDWGI